MGRSAPRAPGLVWSDGRRRYDARMPPRAEGNGHVMPAEVRPLRNHDRAGAVLCVPWVWPLESIRNANGLPNMRRARIPLGRAPDLCGDVTE